MSKRRTREAKSGTGREQTKGFMRLSEGVAECLRGANLKWRLRMIPLDKLKRDTSRYQREPTERELAHLERVWFSPLCEALMVSERKDGGLWVLDGGHRVEVAKRRGVKRLWCRIFSNLTPEQEAAIFHLLDTSHVPLNHHQIHRSASAADEKTIIAAEKIIAKYGCRIPPRPIVDGFSINCVKQIDNLIFNQRINGLATLDLIMKVITSAWNSPEPELRRLDSYIFKGLIYILTGKFRDAIIQSKMINALRKVHPDVFIRNVKSAKMVGGYSTMSKAAGAVLLGLYNKNMKKNRLSFEAVQMASGGKE